MKRDTLHTCLIFLSMIAFVASAVYVRQVRAGDVTVDGDGVFYLPAKHGGGLRNVHIPPFSLGTDIHEKVKTVCVARLYRTRVLGEVRNLKRIDVTIASVFKVIAQKQIQYERMRAPDVNYKEYVDSVFAAAKEAMSEFPIKIANVRIVVFDKEATIYNFNCTASGIHASVPQQWARELEITFKGK